LPKNKALREAVEELNEMIEEPLSSRIRN